MIARYALTYNARADSRIDVELDLDGPWVRWRDLVSHVDRALARLNQNDPDAAREVLEFVVNRETD